MAEPKLGTGARLRKSEVTLVGNGAKNAAKLAFWIGSKKSGKSVFGT